MNFLKIQIKKDEQDSNYYLYIGKNFYIQFGIHNMKDTESEKQNAVLEKPLEDKIVSEKDKKKIESKSQKKKTENKEKKDYNYKITSPMNFEEDSNIEHGTSIYLDEIPKWAINNPKIVIEKEYN